MVSLKELAASAKKPIQSEHILGFDLLRIFSVFLIFLFNLYAHLEFRTDSPELNILISLGPVVLVCLLIVLGFSLSIQYSDTILLENVEALRFYYKTGILNVFPAYLIMMAVTLFLNYSVPESNFLRVTLIPFNLLLLQGHIPAAYPYLGNARIWFLPVLFFMYLIFPFLQILQKHLFKKQFRWVILSYAAVIWIGFAQAFLDGSPTVYHTSPVLRVPEFLIGILLGDIMIRLNGKNLPDPHAPVLLPLVLGVYCFMMFVPLVNIPYSFRYDDLIPFNNNYAMYHFIAVPVFAVSILALFRVRMYRIPAFVSIPIRFLGKLALPFYLVQSFSLKAIYALKRVPALKSVTNGKANTLIVSLFVNFCFSLILYLSAEGIKKAILHQSGRKKV